MMRDENFLFFKDFYEFHIFKRLFIGVLFLISSFFIMPKNIFVGKGSLIEIEGEIDYVGKQEIEKTDFFGNKKKNINYKYYLKTEIIITF